MNVQPKFAATYLVKGLNLDDPATKEVREYIQHEHSETGKIYLNFITGYRTLDIVDGDTETEKKLESLMAAADKNLVADGRPQLEWYKSSVRLRDIALSVLSHLFGALDMTEHNLMTVNPRKTDYTDKQLWQIEYDRTHTLPVYGEIKEALVRGEELNEMRRRDQEAQR